MYFFFFFKQKTAYEMRISDWSSDVCSSDLLLDAGEHLVDRLLRRQLVLHHAADGATPDVFGIHRGELVIVDELERHRRLLDELLVDDLAMRIFRGPERPLGRFLHHREPAAERALGIGRDRKSTRLNSSH